MHLFTQNLKVWHFFILNNTLADLHLCSPQPIELLLQWAQGAAPNTPEGGMCGAAFAPGLEMG